jgi:hypothetical protein
MKGNASSLSFTEPVLPGVRLKIGASRYGWNIAHTTFTRIRLDRPSAAPVYPVVSSNVGREPRHVERLGDKRPNRTSSTVNAVAVETGHSNLGGDKKFFGNRGDVGVGYSPRPPMRVGNRRNQRIGFAVHDSVADSGVIAGDDMLSPFRSPDTCDWLSVVKPVEHTRYNNRESVLTIVLPRQDMRNHNNE